MMRSLFGIFSIALVTACGGSTAHTTTGPIATAELDLQEQFEDFSANFSLDGTKGSFISQRDASLAHVYLYDSTLADNKLARLDDKLALVPAEGKEYLNAISASGTWVVMGRVVSATGLNQLFVAPFAGGAQAKIELEAGHSLNELTFAKGSDEYLAYVERVGTVKTTKVVKVSGDATAVTLTEIGSYPDQEKPKLLYFDNKLQLLTLGTTSPTIQPVTVQTYDPATLAWVVLNHEVPAQSRSAAALPFFVSKAGLFTTETLTTSRTRKKSGSVAVVGTPGADPVAILEDVKQTDIFQSALTYNWDAETYRAQEPLTVSAVSGSLDGQFALASGLDVYSCATTITQLPTLKLIRQSDSKVITWVLARKSTETAWTEVVTNPCGIFDNTLEGGLRQYDSTVVRGEFVGFDGDFAVVAIESFATGDREIRLARFKINWDAGTLSEATILNVSANPRPAI